MCFGVKRHPFRPRHSLYFTTTEYLSGLSWRITAVVPSPFELKISRVSGSNAVAFTSSPMGSAVITRPASAFMIANCVSTFCPNR